MYKKAGEDPKAFLNVTLLQELAQKSFSTFFQHFVSSNLSLTTGGWAYQPINATLPADLGAVDTFWSTQQGGNRNYSIPRSHTNRTAVVQVSTPIEVLEVNTVAVWLSIGIIIWLIVTTIIIGLLQRRYLRNLNCNIDCIGDVLILVAGSDKLLRLIDDMGPRALNGNKSVLTKLGWFQDAGGRQRWGIEVVEVPEEPQEDVQVSGQDTSTAGDVPSSYELQPIWSWRS